MTEFESFVCGRDDLPALRYLSRQAFGIGSDDFNRTVSMMGLPAFMMLRRQGRVVGAAGSFASQQWFGGRPVAVQGISLVMVDPVSRGMGIGTELIRNALTRAREERLALSILYAATRPIYAKLGYERAGSHIRWKAPTRAFSSARMVTPPLQRDPVNFSELDALRTQEAELSNGMLARDYTLWDRHLNPSGEEHTADIFLLFGNEGAEGFLSVMPPENDTLRVMDSCILGRRVAREALAFLSGYASQAETVLWYGGPEDALAHLAHDSGVEIDTFDHWLVRVVDVEQALTLRGYPIGLDADIVIDVIDPLFGDNTGVFRLTVSNGSGQVERLARNSDADIRLNVNALAPLFTAHNTPISLRRMGALDGCDEAMTRAALIFGGPRPWLSDMF